MRRTVLATVALLSLAPSAARAADAPFVVKPVLANEFAGGLAADRAGAAWLVTYVPGMRGAIRVTAVAPGATTGRTFPVAVPKGTAIFTPRIAAGKGVATVVWTTTRAGRSGSRIAGVRCTLRGCGRPQDVGASQKLATQVQVVSDAGGRALVLYRGSSSKGPRTQWATTSGGRFGRVHTLGSIAQDLAAVAGPRGGTTIAWSTARGGVFTSRRTAGEFSRPSEAPGPHGTAPLLAAAGDDVVLAWRTGTDDSEGGPGDGSVYASVGSGGRFATAQRVFAGHARNLTLAGGAEGRAVVTFVDNGALNAAIREPRATFGAPAVIGSTPYNASATAAVLADGRATVAWLHQTGVGDNPEDLRAQTATAFPGGGFGPVASLGASDVVVAAGAGRTAVTALKLDGAWCIDRMAPANTGSSSRGTVRAADGGW